MASRWQPGQLLYVGFEGTTVPPQLAALLRAGRIGGVVLFSRNLRDPHQIVQLVKTLHGLAPTDVPLMLAIDQEGGRVQRLPEPWTKWPPMRHVGACNDLGLTADIGAAIADELRDLGIFLDFAPVVDVDTNPDNPIIGDRSFSRDADGVGRHGAAFITAMQARGVAACAKHFPGHGDTTKDSHLELPSVVHDLHRLREVELVPFRAAVEAKVASIMTAHVVFPALDKRRPATLSPDVMALLRHELGYEGLVFSDDLEMKAVADHHRPQSLVEGCLEAGVDAVLVCRQQGFAEEVLHWLERQPDARLERALERMVLFKETYARRFPAERAEAGVDDEVRGPADSDDPCAPYPLHEPLLERVERER